MGRKKQDPIEGILTVTPAKTVVDPDTGAPKIVDTGPTIPLDRVRLEPMDDKVGVLTSLTSGQSTTVGYSSAYGSNYDRAFHKSSGKPSVN